LIITNDGTVTVTSNVGANAHQMTIDPEAMQHIMTVLSAMYSDNSRAVAREYTANAFDSHNEAGQTRPVEVTLPSDWEPRLVVQDFGVGLDEDGILNVYSVYGKSTRRDSNEAIGGLGIGSKAGFALSGQFVVTGIKGGEKCVALFSLDSNGAPTVEILTKKKTTEANGVTVSIAVTDVAKMRQAVSELARTWPKDKVLIDGAPPQYNIYDKANAVTDDIFLVESHWGLTVDMGGLTYSVPRSILLELGQTDKDSLAHQVWKRLAEGHVGILARVPIGSVSIAPNRETLSNTGKTLTALRKIFQAVADHYTGTVATILSGARNGFEASNLLREMSSTLGEGFLRAQTWKGHKLGEVEIDFPHIVLGYNRGREVAQETGRSFKVQSLLTTTFYQKYLVVYGVSEEDTGKVRRVATRYLANHGNIHEEIIITPKKKGNVGWFSWGDNKVITVMSLDEFRAASRKLPSRSERNETRYTYTTVAVNTATNEKHLIYNGSATGADIADGANGEIYLDNGVNNSHVDAFEVGDVFVGINRQQKMELLEKRLGQKPLDPTAKIKAHTAKFRETVTPEELYVTWHGVPSGNYITKIKKYLADKGYSHPYLDNAAAEYDRVRLASQNLSRDRLDKIRRVRHLLPRVDDSIQSMYTQWSERYCLVESELNSRYNYFYGVWDDAFVTHLVTYLTAIDSKEGK
jgi:hypothetical protein